MATRSLAALLLAALVAACGSSSAGSPPPPPAPALGAQIDRVGRPGVSRLLLAPFDLAATRAAALDAYNASSDPAAWVGQYRPAIAASLAVWDSIDASCGNQFLAASAPPTPTTYRTLATLLADDRLSLRTDQTVCGYLGLELQAAGVGTPTPCGGRRPDEDAVDRTYSLLVAGGLTGVGDGVGIPVDVSSSAFPFLGAPH